MQSRALRWRRAGLSHVFRVHRASIELSEWLEIHHMQCVCVCDTNDRTYDFIAWHEILSFSYHSLNEWIRRYIDLLL